MMGQERSRCRGSAWLVIGLALGMAVGGVVGCGDDDDDDPADTFDPTPQAAGNNGNTAEPSTLPPAPDAGPATTASSFTRSGTYQSSSPSSSGNCDDLLVLLGCKSVADCTVIGTSGSIAAQVSGNSVTITVRGSGAPDEAIVFRGTRDGGAFTATYLDAKSQDGCNSSVVARMSGKDITRDNFTASVTVEITLEGRCFGFDGECVLRSNLQAQTRLANTGFRVGQVTAPTPSATGPTDPLALVIGSLTPFARAVPLAAESP